MTPPEARIGSAINAPTPVRPHLENLVLEFLHQKILEGGDIHSLGPSIRVRRRNEMHGIQSGIEPVFVAGLPGNGC